MAELPSDLRHHPSHTTEGDGPGRLQGRHHQDDIVEATAVGAQPAKKLGEVLSALAIPDESSGKALHEGRVLRNDSFQGLGQWIRHLVIGDA